MVARKKWTLLNFNISHDISLPLFSLPLKIYVSDMHIKIMWPEKSTLIVVKASSVYKIQKILTVR